MRLNTWVTPTRIALFAIVALAAVFRLWHIGVAPPGLYPDEATNGNDALHALQTHDFSVFYPNNGGREGLFINLQAIALLVAGVREAWVLRIVSALVGIATIPGFYFLGTVLWNRRVGLISAALVAGSFWHVVFSRIGFRAIMAPLLLTWALGFLIYGFRKIRIEKPSTASILYVVLGGALAGLGLYTYIAFRAAMLVFVATCAAFTLIATYERKRVITASLLAGLAALIVAAPLLSYFATHPGSFSDRTSQVSVFASEHPYQQIVQNIVLEAKMLVTSGDTNWRHNFSGQPELPLPIFFAVCAGIVALGVGAYKTKGKDVRSITVIALVVAGAIPAVISNEGMPHALRSIMLIVPIFLLAGLGLDEAARWFKKRNMRGAGLVLSICVITYGFGYTALQYPKYVGRPEVAGEFTKSYVALGKILLNRDQSESAYVVVPHGDVLIDGIPVAAQTTMFISGTATKEEQQKANIIYITNDRPIPAGVRTYVMN